MQPENLRFGGGASDTVLHPIVLVAMLIAIALIFLLPRKYVLWPVLSATFLIPLGQEILIGGLHFFVFRIIVLAVGVRMLASVFTSPDGVFGSALVAWTWYFFSGLSSALSPASWFSPSTPVPSFTNAGSCWTPWAATS